MRLSVYWRVIELSSDIVAPCDNFAGILFVFFGDRFCEGHRDFSFTCGNYSGAGPANGPHVAQMRTSPGLQVLLEPGLPNDLGRVLYVGGDDEAAGRRHARLFKGSRPQYVSIKGAAAA